MSANILKGCELARRRYVKEHKGITYYASFEEIGIPDSVTSKAAASPYAVIWWERIKAAAVLVSPNQMLIDELQSRLDIAQKLGLADELPHLAKSLAEVRAAPKELSNFERKSYLGANTFMGAAPILWHDRKKRVSIATAKKNNTRFLLDQFYEELRLAKKSADTLKEIKRYLNGLLAAGILPIDASTIDRSTVINNWKYLASKEWEGKTKNKNLGFFRRFVNWCVTNEYETLDHEPKNNRLKIHRFEENDKEIKKFTEVKKVIESLRERFKVWALLGLNCGLKQADLGRLEWSQIDLEAHTLTRKRHKTKRHKGLPTVTYWLWPETVAELKKIKHRKGLVFVNYLGKPMYSKRFENGKEIIYDAFSTDWQRLKNKPPISLAKFRSIGSTAFKTEPKYDRLVTYWLANKPGNVTDKNYSAEDDAVFFEACKYIRKQLGF